MRKIGRRRFSAALAAGLSTSWLRSGLAEEGEHMEDSKGPSAGGLTDIPGIRVGHFTDERRPTGCTVILAEGGAVCGVDVRGGSPGTKETDLLDPVNSVQAVHGVALSGGSAFGLDTATGVMRFLEERGIGYPVGEAKVPIVPAAIIFDLAVGDWRIRPDAKAGYEAARAASDGPVAEGCVGAGAGATVGKLAGLSYAMKGGLGTAAVELPGGAKVAALVAANPLGDVVDPASGRVLAGVRTEDGKGLRGGMDILLRGGPDPRHRGESSVISVVATNVALSQAEATRVARMAHNGVARTVRPVFTPWDGDTLFALSTGEKELAQPALVVGAIAAEAVARAAVRAVETATSLPGLPSARELGTV